MCACGVLVYMHVYMCVNACIFCVWCAYAYACLHVYRYLQRLEGVGSLELELVADVNHLTWVLGTELGSSGRAARAANH